MTLIELLIVVSLLLLLVIFAIPAVRPGLDAQRLREAARMVNVFLGNARNRAEESGRPYGVEIERVASQPLASVRLYQVEVPPPYGGDLQNSTIAISATGVVTFPRGDFPYNPGLIRTGDMLKLNYQGNVWVITAITPDPATTPDPNPPAAPLTRTWTFSSATTLAMPYANGPVVLPFQIFRQPVRTAVAPVVLPRNTAIDLAYSGTSLTPQAGVGDLSSPVRLLFSPNGAVDRVWWQTGAGGGWLRSADPTYLLVGRRDRVSVNTAAPNSSPAEDGLTNLQDLNNFWIAIQPQTGLTISANVAAGAPSIPATRSLVTPSQAVGGR
jgi:type II secretory pathway pseudopilin PulG